MANNMLTNVGYKPQIVIALLMFVSSSHGVPLSRIGTNTTNSFDIKDEEYAIPLPFSIRLFGDGKFSTLYVNSVGGVSFGAPILSSRLDFIKIKAIIFSPLLIMPDVPADIQIQYLFNAEERDTLQSKFRNRTRSVNFILENVVVVKWNEPTGNEYRIYLATGTNERTYLLYDFENITRIEDSYGFALSGVFAMEDGSVLCPVELEGSGTPQLRHVPNFHLRVDLPLACSSFNYSCNTMDDTPDTIQSQLMAEWKGYFFETFSVTDWTFYRLYMCSSRLTKDDGTIAIKERCEYDPDYYEYSWSQITNSDKCIRRDPLVTR